MNYRDSSKNDFIKQLFPETNFNVDPELPEIAKQTILATKVFKTCILYLGNTNKYPDPKINHIFEVLIDKIQNEHNILISVSPNNDKYDLRFVKNESGFKHELVLPYNSYE